MTDSPYTTLSQSNISTIMSVTLTDGTEFPVISTYTVGQSRAVIVRVTVALRIQSIPSHILDLNRLLSSYLAFL